jgi:hypothetical protein
MIRFAQIAIAAGALVAAVPAQAADFIIDTAAGKSGANAIKTSTAYDSINYAVTSTDGKQTVNVKATAWTLGFDGNYTASRLASWGTAGIGVLQTGETTSNNLHTVDNYNGWEFVVLQFDKVVSLQSAVLNPYAINGNNYVDNDAFIARAAGNFNATMTSATLKSIANGLGYDSNKQSGDFWFNSNSDTYKGAALQTYNLSPDKSGNVWIIGGSVNGPDWKNDAFKLNSIKVTSGVPEPTTWMTMILGFGVVGAALRRRRGATKTSIA